MASKVVFNRRSENLDCLSALGVAERSADLVVARLIGWLGPLPAPLGLLGVRKEQGSRADLPHLVVQRRLARLELPVAGANLVEAVAGH